MAKYEVRRQPLYIGLGFVLLVTTLLYYTPPLIAHWVEAIDNWAYDLSVRIRHRPLVDSHVVIVDINDESIEEIGRWPWPRDKMADLVGKIYGLGATVVGFDVLFSEPEKNIVEQVLEKVSDTNVKNALVSVQPEFDFDHQFAESLQQGKSILAMAFSPDPKRETNGVLPPPFATLTEKEAKDLDIPLMRSYLSNIEILAEASKGAAFINAEPDGDGVVRSAPLVYRYKDGVFPSLGLEVASLYLLAKEKKLVTVDYENIAVLEGVALDSTFVPTDSQGRLLVPYRGHAYTFPYVSAVDILNEKAKKGALEGRIVLIGSSATSLGDWAPTSISPILPGVEIHASVAQGILDGYLPATPPWSDGATIVITFVFGVFLALFAPRVGPFLMSVVTFILVGSLLALKDWAFVHHEIVLPMVFPLIELMFLYLFNMIDGYFIQEKAKKAIRESFGQYVPPEYVEILLKNKDKTMAGESKELSVLFADIRNFTNISEKMSAPEIKTMLNSYFDPLSQTIFEHHGTIDKYVGDMIMAFWGAPIDNPNHASDAIRAAFAMKKRLKELNASDARKGLPELANRIGLNTGVMNVGDMGSTFRKAYTVLGDSVNLASRLESLAKQYHLGILLGENMYEKTKDEFVYRKIDAVKVKGKEQAVRIYEPICPIAEATPQLLDLVKRHAEALDLYQHQKFDSAGKIWKQLQEDNPEKTGLYSVYLERIEQFKKEPPPKDWDGVNVLDTK